MRGLWEEGRKGKERNSSHFIRENVFVESEKKILMINIFLRWKWFEDFF